MVFPNKHAGFYLDTHFAHAIHAEPQKLSHNQMRQASVIAQRLVFASSQSLYLKSSNAPMMDHMITNMRVQICIIIPEIVIKVYNSLIKPVNTIISPTKVRKIPIAPFTINQFGNEITLNCLAHSSPRFTIPNARLVI